MMLWQVFIIIANVYIAACLAAGGKLVVAGLLGGAWLIAAVASGHAGR